MLLNALYNSLILVYCFETTCHLILSVSSLYLHSLGSEELLGLINLPEHFVLCILAVHNHDHVVANINQRVAAEHDDEVEGQGEQEPGVRLAAEALLGTFYC